LAKVKICLKLVKAVFIGLVVTLLLSVVQSSFAAYTVGVKPGDWMKYNVTLSWTGTEPDTSNFGELGEAEYMKGEILFVDGSSVTAKMSMHMTNGSDLEQTLVGNVATGSGNLTIFIIPSGMQEGDNFPSMMFGDQTTTLTVTNTESRTYCGTSRTVNIYSLTAPSTNGFSASIAANWDQATGVLVELSMQMSMTGQSMVMKVLATETNMWSSGIFGGFNFSSDPVMNILIPLVAIAFIAAGATIVASLFLRKRTRPTATMPMPTPASEPAPPQTQ
jgi:hypothetical protein